MRLRIIALILNETAYANLALCLKSVRGGHRVHHLHGIIIHCTCWEASCTVLIISAIQYYMGVTLPSQMLWRHMGLTQWHRLKAWQVINRLRVRSSALAVFILKLCEHILIAVFMHKIRMLLGTSHDYSLASVVILLIERIIFWALILKQALYIWLWRLGSLLTTKPICRTKGSWRLWRRHFWILIHNAN